MLIDKGASAESWNGPEQQYCNDFTVRQATNCNHGPIRWSTSLVTDQMDAVSSLNLEHLVSRSGPWLTLPFPVV
jgi:hypothetical protein